MTRDEQIKQKSEEISQRYFPDSQNIWARQNIEALLVQSACCEMAKWVDENPNQNGKELLYVAQKTADRTKKEFIEKTKKWMKEQCYQEFGGGPLERLIPDELIEDYIKAMEE